MKVGSIVECIDNKVRFTKPLKLKQPYTIRGFCKCPNSGSDGIYLEEVVNEINPVFKRENAYGIERFRELQPPMEIQSALDSCEPVLIEINIPTRK